MLKPLLKTLGKYSPEILTSIACVSTVLAVASAIRESKTVTNIVLDVEEESPEKPRWEITKRAFPHYIPTMIFTGVAISTAVGSMYISRRRIAALSAAYLSAAILAKEYKHEILSMVDGKERVASANERAGAKRKNMRYGKAVNHPTCNEDILCYDVLIDRHFYSTKNKLDAAENRLNRLLNTNGEAVLNELYYELGLEYISIGNELGWEHYNGPAELNVSSHLNDDGGVILTIEPNAAPLYTGISWSGYNERRSI